MTEARFYARGCFRCAAQRCALCAWQGMLQEFIDYLKAKKISPLDEVASDFKLKSQEVVNRVEGLEAMGRITGLLDDRGKFIYISLEEMEAVAKWIKLQGRVSIADLAAESNR